MEHIIEIARKEGITEIKKEKYGLRNKWMFTVPLAE